MYRLPLTLLIAIATNMALAGPLFDSSGVSDLEAETSSSKRLVKLFESPISTSVLSAEQIEKSGATSIVEALRLMPGMIVREQTNGRFEVHIRGFDNALSAFVSDFSAQNILVMIDNRVVFEYFQGGTFWEALPVSIQDIHKIEVVRGAVTSLYGPNAAQGVIHIKTKRADNLNEEQLRFTSTVGTHGTVLGHIETSGVSEHFNWRLSGSYEERDRYQDTYFNFATAEYTDINTLNPSRGIDSYPDPEEASELHRFNAIFNNDPENILAYDLSLSYQDGRSQKAYISSANTALTTNESDSLAVNLKASYYDWVSRISHHWGDREILGFPEVSYDFDITQTSLEYQYRRPRLIVNTGVRVDEMRYEGQFINGEKTLRNQALMFRGEYDHSRDTKLVSSLSLDRYNAPSKKYVSYQLALSHKLSSDTIFRMGAQRANKSSTLVNSFLDLQVVEPSFPNQRVEFVGDLDAKLLQVNTAEFGVRHNLSFFQSIDFEVFYTEAEDYYQFIENPSYLDGAITVRPSLYEPLPTKVTQIGFTADWKYEAEHWDVNAFFTVQKTKAFDQVNDFSTPVTTDDRDDQTTPSFYGGFNSNWRPKNNWNLNATLYVLDETTTSFATIGVEQQTDTNIILNISSRYKHTDAITSTLSIRNLGTKNDSQYYFTDEIEPSFNAGIDIKL